MHRRLMDKVRCTEEGAAASVRP
ncbi:MAG: hypothetical protein RLZZ524_273, partial [Pseudomonadota bacterium]